MNLSLLPSVRLPTTNNTSLAMGNAIILLRSVFWEKLLVSMVLGLLIVGIGALLRRRNWPWWLRGFLSVLLGLLLLIALILVYELIWPDTRTW